MLSEKKLHVDPDITRASTLPSSVYSDPEIYHRALERVFVPSWQVIEVDLLDGQFNVFPFKLLAGSLDEPLVLVREDEDWNCFSNVCTHRGNIVTTRAGHYANLVCGYHGKCFDLKGRFKSMPAFESAKDFPSDRDHLAQLPLESLGPFKFTSIAPRYTFKATLQPMLDRMSWFAFDKLIYEPSLSTRYVVDVHWALYCENYLEGFHIPFVHEQLNRSLKFSEYETFIYPYCNLQLGVARESEPYFDIPTGHEDAGRKILAYYWWLFPNTMLNIYTWGISLNIVKPLGNGQTEILFKTYLLPETKKSSNISATLDQTEMEDEAIVKNVQIGVKSRFYKQGRFSPTMEKGVHHFQQLYSHFLTT
ncbi:MAG: Rieske 2Fe-2S domain-containing protein [Saprospiraceae bacterium]|nr:Rieske 2Fe-2S domain-containing protein [Saprospiraceae bacterium]